jgi:serine/threonine-protein kinase
VQRRRSRALVVLLPLLGLLAGAGIAIAALQSLTARPPAATAQAAEQRQAQGVVLVARDYVGRSIDDVAGQLAAYGLSVQRQLDPAPPRRAAPGTVTSVAPTGVRLQPGSSVVVRYVASQAPSRAGGGATGVSETALTHAAAPSTGGTVSSSAAAASSAAPTTRAAGTTGPPVTGSQSSPPPSTTAASTPPSSTPTPSDTAGPTASSSPPAA